MDQKTDLQKGGIEVIKDVSMGPYVVLATGAPGTTTWKMKSQAL